ncbi:MAG: hypothetical protein O3A85_04750 [Proteobacteria bacterium]|nr:hypothetical protein [Pseudomonadota bacterium]
MTTVIAVLSFTMAFGAIWFTSEALKRVDSFNAARLKPHMGKVHRAIDEFHETVLSLKRRMEALEKDVRMLKVKGDLSPLLERDTAALQAELGKAQQFIPSINLNG